MKLTKDDLPDYLKNPLYGRLDIVDQILKNQEITEFYTNLTKEYEDGLTPELFKEWKEDAERWRELGKPIRVDLDAIEIVSRLKELVAKEKKKWNWYVQIFDIEKYVLGEKKE